MLRGANAKRQREFEHLVDQFEDEQRYPGREEEVAARIVNKQRQAFGETASEKEKDKQGKSPDRHLPIHNYQGLTIPQINRKLSRLSVEEIKRIREFEVQHRNRHSLIAHIDRTLQS